MKRTALLILMLTATLPALAGEPPARVWKNGKWVPAAKPKLGTAEGEIALIRAHLARDNPKKALKIANAFGKRYPQSPLREEAMMLAGQAQMNRGHYWDAYERFEDQLAAYPGGEYFDRILQREYEIADAFLKGRKRRFWGIFRISAKDEALDMLTRIAEHDPNSDIAQRAIMRVADYHYAREQWKDAIVTYDDYINLFGKKNPKQARYASLQAAWASYKDFRGVRYDETPLLEAEQRFRTFLKLYPDTARLEGIPGVLDEIRTIKAHKEYRKAEFYIRTHRKNAAAYYLRRTIKKYDDTKYAGKARKKLAKMGLPLQPPTEKTTATGPAPLESLAPETNQDKDDQ
ncbi:MAG: outer membrane protein assembly factor BamD [Phycisphaerae bacterium]